MRAEAQAHIDQVNAATALLRRFLDWDRALKRLEQLNGKVEDPSLWNDPKAAQDVMRERRRLDELKAGDLAVKATFELGYGQLSSAQARAFRLLSLPEAPDLSLDAAAAVLDLDPYDAEDLLESLVDISLLESAAPARYPSGAGRHQRALRR